MRKKTVIGISLFAILGLAFFTYSVFFLPSSSSLPDLDYDPSRFVFKQLCNQLNEPIEFEVLNSGDILLIERRGGLKLYSDAKESIHSAGKIDVGYGLETGLLGLALDPDFTENNWIYLFYTDPVSRAAQRVSRFDFRNNELINASEKTLLEIPFDEESCCHHGGALEFGPDGNLFISTGDNTLPTNYAFDERPEKRLYDAQRTAANTMDLRGKILRIKPTSGGKYTIPEGNLFDPSNPKSRPEIYVMGARNPFRISVDQKTGWLFWGDVGPNTGSNDPRRGPNTLEEFNVATTAGNFGWPYLLGDNQAFSDFDFTTQEIGAPFDPLNLKNDSPNNTGISNLPPANPALVWYPMEVSDTFPALGSGGGSAMTGPVFNYQASSQNDLQLPKSFDKKLFIFEWMRSWIMAVELDSTGQYVRMEEVFPERPFIKPIQMKFGPKGAMYVLDYGSNWYTQNVDAGITKITYYRGNRPPIAKINTPKYQQAAPFNFTASAKNTFDSDQEKQLSYEWQIDGKTIGKKINVSQVFEEAGTYQLVLKITDSEGASSQDSLNVYVGNEPPKVNLALTTDDGFYQPGTTLNYEVEISDLEDDKIQHNQIETQLTSLDKGIPLPGTENDQSAIAIPIKQNFYPGEIFINESDCRACHAAKKKSVGPSWKQIAEKYTDQPATHLSVAKKIITGGKGVWGEKIMSAHPQFSEEEAMEMFRYILSFNAPTTSGADTLHLTPTGTIRFDNPQNMKGRFSLQTSYSDQGANGMPPISVTTNKILRPRILGPDQFDFYNNTSVSTDEISKTRKAIVGYNGAYIGFKNINLKNTDFIKIRLRTNATRITVETRVNSSTGELIGTSVKKLPKIDPYPSMKEVEWFDLQIPLSARPNQRENLYLIVHTDKGRTWGMDYQSIAEIQKVAFETTTE